MRELIFFLSLITLLYIYCGYPLMVYLVSLACKKKVKKGLYEPTVTIAISAYNEEAHIHATIENKLQLDYPKDKLDIIVVSDGSTDRTDAIVKKFPAEMVHLIRQEPRKGKTSALNKAVPLAKGEIIVFSDANSLYAPDTLRHLVNNFNDPEVGYVTGKMIYVNPDRTIIGKGCSTYMQYENILRKHETQLGSIVGVDGGIDAVRKCLYQPMHPDQLPDFILPLKVVERGYRVVYEPHALLHEVTSASSEDEYQMRVRVSLRALWALSYMKHLLNVKHYGLFSWELLSHKWLRYFSFIFLIALYITNLSLWHYHIFFKLFFISQNIFYLGALGIFLGEKRFPMPKILYIPCFFTLINTAAAHAFIKFLCGERQTIWIPRKG